MVKAKPARKRYPELDKAVDYYIGPLFEYTQSRAGWKEALQNPSEELTENLSDRLARLGYSPAEDGSILAGRPFEKGKIDPRVLLYYWMVGASNLKQNRFDSSLSRLADTLSGALLVWAGVIELDGFDDQDTGAGALSHTTGAQVRALLILCDLEAFIKRRNSQITKEAIRENYDSGRPVITEKDISAMFRNYRFSKQ